MGWGRPEKSLMVLTPPSAMFWISFTRDGTIDILLVKIGE
jgi:hypothetical protein